MKLKSEAHVTLARLHDEVGIFHTMIPDNAPELTSGEKIQKESPQSRFIVETGRGIYS
jgi:hypothetical protein